MDANFKAATFAALNIVSSCGIVFANKAVFSTFGFHFTYALTLLHTWVTAGGMLLFLYFGVFQRKKVPLLSLTPLAAAYVGYIVLSNLNLQVNSVSFYQISKIAVAPVVLFVEAVFFKKPVTRAVTASVMVVCFGVGLSTLTDFQLGMTTVGFAVGLGHIVATSFYLIWVGSKQKELGLTSMQLLDQYSPVAGGLLVVLVPVLEDVGWKDHAPGTLLAYEFTPMASLAIAISSVLGLAVSLSTFLFIGATSSLTYNVVGHVKTLIILAGGFLVFGEPMPFKKALGIFVIMIGIVWYSMLSMKPHAAPSTTPVSEPLLSKSTEKASPVPAAMPPLPPNGASRSVA